MQPSFDRASDRRRYLWFIFALSALVAIGLFFIPAFIIRPFTHQSARGLVLAMALRDRATWGTLCAASICLLLAMILWRGSKHDAGSGKRGRDWTRRIVLSVVMLLVAFSAVMSRLNYFEWMFHPVDSPQFESASASKLDNGEMILALRFGTDARAYPIREMAYHHIVNDVVGSVPVAVTY